MAQARSRSERRATRDYFNAVTLSNNEVLESQVPAGANTGGITFHSTVDALTAGGQSLTTKTDGTTTFDGLVGSNFALSSLTAEGNATNLGGFADLNATGAITVKTTGNQDYFNAVTLTNDQVLESQVAAGANTGGITFHSTVDALTAGGRR